MTSINSNHHHYHDNSNNSNSNHHYHDNYSNYSTKSNSTNSNYSYNSNEKTKMKNNTFSFLGVHRGMYLEVTHEYERDDEDIDTTRRLLWPDRGDGTSFVSRDDYPDTSDDEDGDAKRHERIKQALEARRAMLAQRTDRSSPEPEEQDEEESVIFFDDSEDEVDDHNDDCHSDEDSGADDDEYDADDEHECDGPASYKRRIHKRRPNRQVINLGYDADDEHDSDEPGDCKPYDGSTTPQCRSPRTEPPHISRGYDAETTVALLNHPHHWESSLTSSPSSSPCTPFHQTRAYRLRMAELEDDSSEFYSEEDDSKNNDTDEDDGPRRWPLSDSQLITISEPIISRGWRSCGQVDDQASPFLVPPRYTDLPLFESSPSDKSTTGGYQPQEFVDDFGASILAACPLGPMQFQHEEVGEVSSPLRASVNPRKHARSFDLGEEEDERDTKLRHLSSMPQVQDFGASTLAARPLGSLPVPHEEGDTVSSPLRASVNWRKHARSSDLGEEECERDRKLRRLSSMPRVLEEPQVSPVAEEASTSQNIFVFGAKSPTFDFSFEVSTQPGPASPLRMPPQVETPARAPPPSTPPLPPPALTSNADTLEQTPQSDILPSIEPTTHPQDDNV
ncbi:hypothetical protein BGW41_000351 [Actinomortierella wolfii]|nr:hypothetical protein BGW41_000351 [Actinomortierella wolfii]